MITETQLSEIVFSKINSLTGQRVLVILPDATRTMPLPAFFRAICAALLGKATRLDFLIALGTHPPMDEAAILRLVGITPAEKATTYQGVNLYNHDWKNPNALITLGIIPADEIAHISGGLLTQDVPVQLNRRVLDYDHLLVCGPVFPHEVVGFSGGNKYFFPGIAGSSVIDFTHWLGALITSYVIIGTADTPVRQVINRAASLIPRPRSALCSVVTHQGLEGVFYGTPEDAWQQAAALSAQLHVRYVEKPYKQVLSVLPEMYDEIWVGAKGMYKMEPVIADGGEVILYAPHIRHFSVVHGETLRKIGYHVRDYFVKQWDRFKDLPWGVLAHSTHLRGIGTYENGMESPRIRVTLATGISQAECEAMNLGYRDPRQIDPTTWGHDDLESLVVPRAGEYLYRLKP